MPASTPSKLPWWLLLVIVLETLPMFLGPYVALTNPKFMGGPEAEAINQAAYIYSARNVAVGIALMVAAALRNPSMLFALILVRLITDICDLPTLLQFGLVQNTWLVSGIFVFLYYIPAPLALRFLWKRMAAGQSAA